MNQETLQLAKAFENMTLSKKDAVNKFGTKEQKNHFEKYKKFTNKKLGAALLKTLNQLFEDVDDTVKVGRGYGYKLGAARTQVAERKDNRGGNELGYTKYLDAVVLMALNNKMFDKHETTMAKWVYHFGLANKALFLLKTAPRSEEAIRFKKKLKEQEVSSSVTMKAEFQAFISDYEDKERILKNVFKKLRNNNLIEFYKVPKAVIRTGDLYKDENGKLQAEKTVVTLDTEAAARVADKQAELREKYNLTEFQITSKYKSKEVQKRLSEYQIELEDYYFNEMYYEVEGKLKRIQVEYTFFNYAVYIKATKTKIKDYIKKNRPEFYEEYIADENLFFNNVKENYNNERKVDLLNKAYKKAQEEYDKVLKQEKGFGKEVNERRNIYLNYWENQYVSNIANLEPHLRANFVQDISKQTSYKSHS